MPITFLSAVFIYLILRITFEFGVNLSGVTLIGDLDREDVDIGELISMHVEKC